VTGGVGDVGEMGGVISIALVLQHKKIAKVGISKKIIFFILSV
jgi:hypothetical protein